MSDGMVLLLLLCGAVLAGSMRISTPMKKLGRMDVCMVAVHPNAPSYAPPLVTPQNLPSLTWRDKAQLSRGERVQKQERYGGAGVGLVVLDVKADREKVFATLSAFDRYQDLIPTVRGVRIHESNGPKTSAEFKLSKFRLLVNVVHNVSPETFTVSFNLDPSRPNLILREAQGFWHLQTPSDRPGYTRVWFRASVVATRLLPTPVIDYASSKALPRATSWLQPYFAAVGSDDELVVKLTDTTAPSMSSGAPMGSNDSDGIVTLEAGWDREIKPKGILVLQEYLTAAASGKPVTSKALFTKAEYMHVYSTCYNMCTQRAPYCWSAELYHRYEATFEEYLKEAVVPALLETSDSQLLSELISRWNNHKTMIKWMKQFFVYLDRYFVRYGRPEGPLPSLEEVGLSTFHKLVFEEVKESVVASMLALVDAEREGVLVDTVLMRACVSLFEAMGMGTLEVYVEDLERSLLAGTKQYYARKAEAWLRTDSTPAYLIKVEKALDEEKTRVFNYLNPETEQKLLRVVEEEALERREGELLDKDGSGCRALLAVDKEEDLARMFRLFARLPDGLAPMADLFRTHVESLGNAFIEQRTARIEHGDDDRRGSEKVSEKVAEVERKVAAEEDRKGGEREENEDPVFVRDLLGLHDKYVGMVAAQFSGNALFQKALKDAFVEVVNKNVGKYPNSELLSSFCDRILKTGGEKVSERESEELLEKVVQLFSYLTDKDMFAELYRNQLAKRLLNQRSASDETERLMIGKLKLRCGAQFTTKMEGMLNDLAIGADHQSDFERFVKAQDYAHSKVDFSVQVLTTGHWPSYKAVDVTLPPIMAQSVQVFREFYEDKNGASRRLAFTHSLGSVTLKATFGKKSYDLQLTTLQVAALMLFNESSAAQTFEAIQQSLNLTEDVLKRVLHSLASGKHKVLRKMSIDGKDSGTIRTSDSFAVNDQFTSPLRKIRIPMASLDESHNPKKVEEDRSIIIEAAIVRIMKARKTLAHQQLVGEVLSQLAFFRPNPKVVKGRIEALIGREFLERDADNPNTYKYVA